MRRRHRTRRRHVARQGFTISAANGKERMYRVGVSLKLSGRPDRSLQFGPPLSVLHHVRDAWSTILDLALVTMVGTIAGGAGRLRPAIKKRRKQKSKAVGGKVARVSRGSVAFIMNPAKLFARSFTPMTHMRGRDDAGTSCAGNSPLRVRDVASCSAAHRVDCRCPSTAQGPPPRPDRPQRAPASDRFNFSRGVSAELRLQP